MEDDSVPPALASPIPVPVLDSQPKSEAREELPSDHFVFSTVTVANKSGKLRKRIRKRPSKNFTETEKREIVCDDHPKNVYEIIPNVQGFPDAIDDHLEKIQIARNELAEDTRRQKNDKMIVKFDEHDVVHDETHIFIKDKRVKKKTTRFVELDDGKPESSKRTRRGKRKSQQNKTIVDEASNEDKKDTIESSLRKSRVFFRTKPKNERTTIVVEDRKVDEIKSYMKNFEKSTEPGQFVKLFDEKKAYNILDLQNLFLTDVKIQIDPDGAPKSVTINRKERRSKVVDRKENSTVVDSQPNISSENSKSAETEPQSNIVSAKKEKKNRRETPRDRRSSEKDLPKKNKRKPREKKKFLAYYSTETVDSGIRNGELFAGILRIRNNKMSYVTCPAYGDEDIPINGSLNRNRALDGDSVVVKVLEDSSGQIVHVLEKNHPRICIGKIKPDPCVQYLPVFFPRDIKIPKMIISKCSSYRSVKDDPHIYLVEIIEYEEEFPICRIIKNIGDSSNFTDQYEAIKLENSLDLNPVSSDLFPFKEFEIINPYEYEYREDFRKTCIFTIDPSTARDLDDAVSCVVLKNGNYEIGVHISDVTHYLKEDTPLDKIVSEKTTTIYLTDKTYHMLPEAMCLLLSLLPGVDKLCFSVIWEITPTGEIKSHRFTRSIINSCSQLSYEQAQKLIETPLSELNANEYSKIHGDFALVQLAETVKNLQKIASIFTQQRIARGCLRLDQPKIYFNLNHPMSFHLDERKESNSLIEEFMLLANSTVARHIYEHFPTLAFLRKHPLPKNNIKRLIDKLKLNGINIDASSAGALQTSLSQFDTNDDDGRMKFHVLQRHLVKTLARAEYFCAKGDSINTRHYALNVDLYTHFTSPIRRYADVMVHRLLSSSLMYTPKVNWSEEEVQRIAKRCNIQKSNAKNAADMSTRLYFMKYLCANSPLYYRACVVDIFEFGVEIIIPEAAFVDKVQFDSFSESKHKVKFVKGEDEATSNAAIVEWVNETGNVTETLKMFSIVNVVLKKSPDDIMRSRVFVQKPEF